MSVTNARELAKTQIAREADELEHTPDAEEHELRLIYLIREYQLTVVCREEDEIHIRAVLSNAMYAEPLSFQSLTSRDCEDHPPRVEVTATCRAHPSHQARLEQIASRISMEKGVTSVSWSANEAEPAPE